MENPQDIARKIRRLSSAGGPGGHGRQLRAFGDRSLLATLLLEIDETILPRGLRISNVAGDEISLSTANRRLMRVSASDGAGRDDVAIEPDSHDPDSLNALLDLLEGFIDGSETLRLRSEAPGSVTSGMIGVSARRLSETWGAPMDPPETLSLAEQLDAVLMEHRSGIVAWQRRQDGQTDCGGDAGFYDDLGPLSATLEKRALRLSQTLSDLSRERCLFTLDHHGEAGLGVILAALDGTVLTLLVKPEAQAPLASALRDLLHGWPAVQAA
ncbi:hypothetical protein [Tropicimonas sediminicola]|uniref:Uncharacterized protein n=1 Tax=Tropicimonas sediminicola TaxID=1031541 RepID=A0A239JQ29_9RHOB|nr:hypothetical protein [Tropicimonas sediminicola]SNT07925.1 hypothetical protein SAMN05421757_1069 [Tropicimonas sediminicola]